ncbi:hypothetical protein F52700_335 [Fusarium sp. NRRL 52700]|nr:hypothetical protein F52700_335 [Fusarium sp. NRRL 52700]
MFEKVGVVEVSLLIDDRVVGHGSCSIEHVLRNFERSNRVSSGSSCPASKSSKAASKIKNFKAFEVWDVRSQPRPFWGRIETLDRLVKRGIPSKEFSIIVNVLRHNELRRDY